jgi:hypothetical protein
LPETIKMECTFIARNYENGMYFHCQKLQKWHVISMPETIKIACIFIARNCLKRHVFSTPTLVESDTKMHARPKWPARYTPKACKVGM